MGEFLGFALVLVIFALGMWLIVWAEKHDQSKESDSDDRRT